MSQYTISRLTTSEEKALFLGFWNRFQGKDQSAVLDWLYARKGLDPIIFLLIEDMSQQCVGCLMVIPRQLYIESKVYNIGIAGVFIVDEKHRTLLPALRLTKHVKALIDENAFELVYGLPNDKAAPVFTRAGFKKLGPFIRLSRALSVSRRLDPGNFKHRIVKPVASLYDSFSQLIQAETWHRTPADFRCETVDVLDARFDPLWKAQKDNYLVLGDRSREYLQWRFNMYTGANISIYCLISKSKASALGYIAYRDKNGYISIRDAIVPGDPVASRSLILNFLRHCRKLKSKSVSIELLENEKISEIFKEYGFSESSLDQDVYYIANKDIKANHPIITDYRNWLLFRGDMDP